MTASTQKLSWIFGVLAALAGLLALFGVAYFYQARADRELRELPEHESRALYERTLETLRTSCAHMTGPNLSEYCRQQADIIQRFPYCDRACREIAEKFAAHPAR
ncbi:MAG TPA: hypothetical protein VI072_21685 [Polyangiaceae bacterium]